MIRTPLVLCLALAACSAPHTAPTAGRAPRTTPQSSPTRRPEKAPATVRGLRPTYTACIEKADAVIPATQACIDEEGDYQQARLDRALADAKQTHPERAATLQFQQTAWQADTDAKCAWDESTEGQQQRIEANMCSLKAIAERADELTP